MKKYDNTIWLLFIPYIIALITIIAIVTALTGCKPSQYASQKQLNKIQYYHPELLSKYCSDAFPVIMDTRVIHHSDTVQQFIMVDCDTTKAKADTVIHIISRNRPISVPCPPSIFIHDTIIRTQENNAKTDQLTGENKTLKSSYDKANAGKSIWMWIAISFMGLEIITVAAGVWLLKSKIIP